MNSTDLKDLEFRNPYLFEKMLSLGWTEDEIKKLDKPFIFDEEEEKNIKSKLQKDLLEQEDIIKKTFNKYGIEKLEDIHNIDFNTIENREDLEILEKEQNRVLIRRTLKQFWNYNSFRGNQEEAVLDMLEGKNLVYTAKTGDGKSICYQLPSLLASGLTIIISPLKVLMKDQVESLLKKGIPATYLNSDLEESESKKRVSNLLNGEYKLLYLSPEKLSMGFKDFLIENLDQEISYFIIDEFDTVDEYGSSGFRPEYLELGSIKDDFQRNQDSEITVGIFTATATNNVIKFVLNMMRMNFDNFQVYKGPVTGPNLHYQIDYCDDRKELDTRLLAYVKQIQKNLDKDRKKQKESGDKSKGPGSCIIFCTTTKDVEKLYKVLKGKGFSVRAFHGQMAVRSKNVTYREFMNGTLDFVVCTNAFGRGVDKSDIRYILHYGLPGNISSYLQEIGRGGRDTYDFTAITLFDKGSIGKRQFLLGFDDSRKKEFGKLIYFLLQKHKCRTQILYEHFNIRFSDFFSTSYIQQAGGRNKCLSCDICQGNFIEVGLSQDLNSFSFTEEINKEKKKRKQTRKRTTKKTTTRKRKTSTKRRISKSKTKKK